MPYCKYCHREITRFDSDICPHCGGKKPLEDNYKTMDVTQTLTGVKLEGELYRSKSRKTFALLCCLAGYAGAHSFYLGKNLRGAIELLISILIIGGFGSLLYFAAAKSFLCYLIPALLVVAFYVAAGVFYLFNGQSLKDGHGELLR